MTRTLHRGIAIAAITALVASTAFADEKKPLQPTDFDTGDGVIDADELLRYRQHKASAAFRAADRNRDGTVSPDEIIRSTAAAHALAHIEAMTRRLESGESEKAIVAAEAAKLAPKLERMYLPYFPGDDGAARAAKAAAEDAPKALGGALAIARVRVIDAIDIADQVAALGVDSSSGTRGLPPEVAIKNFGVPPKEKPFAVDWLYLRRDASELASVISALRDSNAKLSAKKKDDAFKKSKGAVLSYTRDEDAETNAVQAEGALGFPFRIADVDVLASVTVNRIKDDGEDTVDSLVWGLSTASYTGPLLGFENSALLWKVSYATDHRFDSAVYAGEVDWEPTIQSFGTPIPMDFGLPLAGTVSARLRPTLHAEFGRTDDAGENEKLEDNDGFMRWGPRVELGIWPHSVRSLSLSAIYAHLESENASEVDEDSDYFKASLEYALGKNTGLSVSYRNGVEPLTREDAETFIVGLTFKF